MIEFKEMNLAQPWPAMAPADIVFMLNVLIYFNVETKKAILTRVRKLMKPDGYLFVGGEQPWELTRPSSGSRSIKAHTTLNRRRIRRGFRNSQKTKCGNRRRNLAVDLPKMSSHRPSR